MGPPVSVLPDIRRPATRRVNARPYQPPPTPSSCYPQQRRTCAGRPQTQPPWLRASRRKGQGSDMAPDLPSPCQDLLDLQHGVIARWQAPEAGLNVRMIDSQLRNGRWQALSLGVYATFTGQPSRMAVLWAAVLRGGPGAALSYETAAELDRLVDRPTGSIHVTVGSLRQLTISGQEGWGRAPKIIVHRYTRLNEARHPARTPPRTRIEETVIDLVQASPDIDQAMSWLITACGRRLTTAGLLLASMATRPRLRWRAELAGALTE